MQCKNNPSGALRRNPEFGGPEAQSHGGPKVQSRCRVPVGVIARRKQVLVVVQTWLVASANSKKGGNILCNVRMRFKD